MCTDVGEAELREHLSMDDVRYFWIIQATTTPSKNLNGCDYLLQYLLYLAHFFHIIRVCECVCVDLVGCWQNVPIWQCVISHHHEFRLEILIPNKCGRPSICIFHIIVSSSIFLLLSFSLSIGYFLSGDSFLLIPTWMIFIETNFLSFRKGKFTELCAFAVLDAKTGKFFLADRLWKWP